MNEAWIEIAIIVSPAASEAVSNHLIELGSQGTVFEELPKDPENCRIKAYYPEALNANVLIGEIRNYLNDLQALDIPVGDGSIAAFLLEDTDWNANWKQYFKPARVGEHLVIKPSWEAFEAQPEDLIIEIDPGMAFGSGLHASTRLVLTYLERYLRPGMTVLDVGVGSGILSIAAARLGAEYVLGLDIDADAVAIASDNVQKNAALSKDPAIAERIDVQEGSLDTLEITHKFDCIVMNIRPNIILPLMAYVEPLLQTGGAVILSGILEEEGPDLTHALHDLRFVVHESLVDEEWIAYVLSYI